MDVYDINEDLVKCLVKVNKIEEYSKKFNEFEKNYEKVNYVENLLIQFRQFSKLNLKIEKHINKNNEKSLNYRKEGNKYFSLKNKNYCKALEFYNKSICYAEEGSENLSIGYANRSAILFEWHRYKECLRNIQLAEETNYPERLKEKLNKRKQDCLEMLAKETTIDDMSNEYEFKLSYDRHPKVPFIADCLDMKYTKDLGRYIYTKKDLKPGDLISIEEPFCSILLPFMRYIRCGNCKIENLTLIPCPYCTSAMFCSTECLNESLNTFHKYECPIVDVLFGIFNKIHLIALRVTMTALMLFDNIDDFIEFCNDENNHNQNAFTIDYNKNSKKELYRAIHGLVTNQEKRSVSDLFQRSVVAAVLKRLLLEHTDLGKLLPEEKHKNFFVDILFQHFQTSPSNMHCVVLIEQEMETKDDQSFASAAYAFGSLLNHSCAPNTVRIYKNTLSYMFVLRPIPANGLLYDNYGYHFATQPKKNRLKNLDLQYRFTCNCEGCEMDYPMYNDMPIPNNVPQRILSNDIYSLMIFNKKFASDNYKDYCEYLEKYQKYYPCAQISATEESLKMALNILADAVPLKAKYKKQ